MMRTRRIVTQGVTPKVGLRPMTSLSACFRGTVGWARTTDLLFHRPMPTCQARPTLARASLQLMDFHETPSVFWPGLADLRPRFNLPILFPGHPMKLTVKTTDALRLAPGERDKIWFDDAIA